MKYLRSFFWLVLAVSIGGTGVVEASVVTDGVGALDQQEGMLLIELDRVSYQLGTPVCIRVVADEYALALGPDRVVVEITRLTEVVAVMAKSIYDPAVTSWRFNWQPPEETAGYGLTVWLEHGGERLVFAESAFDVAEDWTEQPRYGFVSDYGAWDESKERAAFQAMSRLHLNGVQFYDWLYRHDTPVPPGDWFVDSMGRHLRVETIRRKIGLAREFGMVPMAYVAVYAASPAFYAKHQQWGLYDRTGSPIDFGDGYLFLMDPSRGAGWDAHLLGEFRNTLECFHFAGIHIDQYGYPKVAYDAQGGAIVLASAFRTFINDTKSTLSEVDNTRDYVTFNSVANWPAAIVAESTYDFNYVEVWPPYSSYGDIERIIQSAYENSGGKATVIAAYVDAQEEATVRLLDAVIFAHGGTHIEMGEGDRMLVDPYFPKAQQVSASLWKSLVSYYDFIVRYKEWLYGDREPVAACECVLLDGEAAGPRPVPGRVHAICYRLRDQGQYVLSLINFTGANSDQWKAAQPQPEYIDRVEVTMTIDHKPEAIWVASPDKPSLRAVPIPFIVTSDFERITVQFSTDLSYWSVILFE